MQYVGGWRSLTGGAGDDRLVAAGEPESELRAVDRLSIPVFFATAYAWLLWIIIPILAARLRRLQQRAEP
jgi:hypothetical protein